MQDYTLIERIGRGSFGQVFKAVSKTSKLNVAIKILDLDNDDEAIQDVRAEIAILSKCSSPLVTAYYSSILVGSKLWVVMEYAAGGSIRNLMKSGTLDEECIKIVTRSVLEALIYLHKTVKIIHRDIKAANILVTSAALVQVCDFGVAGQMTMKSRRNSMAPEIITRQEYGFKADIWSLGITVIEMATGNPPFSDQEPRRALFLIPKSRPPKLSGEFSSVMQEFIATCLKEDPDDRPDSTELIKSPFLKLASLQSTKTLRQLMQRHEIWRDTHNETGSEGSAASEDELEGDDWDFSTMRASMGLNPPVYRIPEDSQKTPTDNMSLQALSFDPPVVDPVSAGREGRLLHAKHEISTSTSTGWSGDGGWKPWGFQTAPMKPLIPIETPLPPEPTPSPGPLVPLRRKERVRSSSRDSKSDIPTQPRFRAGSIVEERTGIEIDGEESGGGVTDLVVAEMARTLELLDALIVCLH